MSSILHLEIPGNNRIFFIEGLDRTGKSTFAKNLEAAMRRIGKKPILYHMSGPSEYKGLDGKFTSDEKSLIQLAKFDEDFKMIESALKADEDIIFILDRSQFGERVWSEMFSREGKYTQYNISSQFYLRYSSLLKNSLYIDFQMSDIKKLKERYFDSPEDLKNMRFIASQTCPSMTLNSSDDDTCVDIGIQNCLDSFDVLKGEAEKLVKTITIDSSKFETLEDNERWVNDHVNDLIQYNGFQCLLH